MQVIPAPTTNNSSIILIASFTANVTSGTASLAVQFTDTSTGSPTNWTWDFGDGETSEEQNPSHTYEAAGTYDVSLTAANAAGDDTMVKEGYINVTGEGPVADFSGSPLSGDAPLDVQFTDLSTGLPTSWSWDFGDESYSTDQSPLHTYTAAGTYDVSLTVENAGGSDTKVSAGFITVTEEQVSNQATDVEGRNIPSDIYIYPNYIEDAATKQRDLGYAVETKYCTQSTTMRSYIQDRLQNDTIFFFHGHGLEGGGVINVDEDTNEYYYATNAPYGNPYEFSAFSSLSNLQLAIFLACQSGLGLTYNGNLVDEIVNKGGQCALGWTDDLDSPDSSIYGEEFWNQMDGHTTPLYAHSKSKDAVKNSVTCINWHAQNPTTTNEYCNYDKLYSNGLGCNNVLPDVSSESMTASNTLQNIVVTARNNINPSKSSLVSSKNAIQKFTTDPKATPTFKKGTHYSYGDLYEFNSEKSSSFTVNSVTGRVQNAAWNEAGSKDQKEIITLDQGYKIAEAFAKEKYPELWNVSDTRGIKLTRNEVLDRGIDRQFCFAWDGVLYDPSSIGSQRTEVLDSNGVSVTVSPYTGRIIDYNELYLPSVFAYTALTNLTPTVTEEQAKEYALTEFRSLGIKINQPGDIESLGIRTTVDNNLIPYLTWAFNIEQNERQGKDVTYVNVDVIDGHIVWSQTFVGDA